MRCQACVLSSYCRSHSIWVFLQLSKASLYFGCADSQRAIKISNFWSLAYCFEDYVKLFPDPATKTCFNQILWSIAPLVNSWTRPNKSSTRDRRSWRRNLWYLKLTRLIFVLSQISRAVSRSFPVEIIMADPRLSSVAPWAYLYQLIRRKRVRYMEKNKDKDAGIVLSWRTQKKRFRFRHQCRFSISGFPVPLTPRT